MKAVKIVCCLLLSAMAWGQAPKNFTVLSNPLYLGYNLHMKGSENLIMVPENRSNPQSRTIGVHFIKLNAQQRTNLPPVFYLRGGPGEATSPKEFYTFYTRSKHSKALAFEVATLNQKRDVILISQRGASRAGGLPMFHFKYQYYVGSKTQAFDPQKSGQRQAKALKDTLCYYQKIGVDPAGYDIINLIDDIEDVRKYYGYSKLALVGNSFGSQTALAYLKHYPKRVDRALLSAVEPLSHGYDDPDEVWKVLQRVAAYAQADPAIKNHLPAIGLLGALKTIVKRLEKKPLQVTFELPRKGKQTVTIGVHDFHQNIFYAFAKGRRKRLETWPKYINELYNGDYRTLAYAALRGRVGHETENIMSIQIDNSLGISPQREKLLNTRKSVRWLGEINAASKSTRGATTSAVVSDDFRTPQVTQVPMVLIHGELDKNTPLSNATFLMKYLKNGHLITTQRGVHSNKWDLFLANKDVGTKILRFMEMDFTKTSFQEFKKTLPDTYAFAPLKFSKITGDTLFDKLFKD